ncbi:MAG TPA: response regulator [Ktedonobacterales bacterium]
MSDLSISHAATPLVLILEDEEPIAIALSLIIEDAGYAAVYTTDARHALALVREHSPALILTDLMMPRMNGGQFVTALREQASREGIPMPPVVLMTATDLRYATEIGADAVLGKPFDLKTVEALLTRFLPQASVSGNLS